MNLIVLSIPLFFVLMGAEWVAGRVLGRRVFRGPDVFANLSLGAAQTVFGVVAGGLLAGAYVTLYSVRWFEIPTTSPVAWGLLLLGTDFCYYWFHRVSHRTHLGWMAHAPHHQSEDFNLSVALRQGPVQPFFSRVFYLPLALLGFPPAMFATVVALNTLYQFWVHTELIDTLGPLEWVLVTPSHHRVHHACNGRYLDKNHGAMLILWDRLFGTFEPERGRVTYGTVEPVRTFNPLLAAWRPFQEAVSLVRRTPRFQDKLRFWFMPPEWQPPGVESPHAEVAPGRPRFDVSPPRRAVLYLASVGVLTLGVTVVFLFRAGSLSAPLKLAFTAWFLASLGGLGGVLEGRRWAWWVEAPRLAVVPLAVLSL
ncbi:sterol desaturase family protein [Stigmatella aurantiaca]|uniref:Sterol desaturase family protein n=1 Tax=Stigmatella aurantiaca (strain DW4/3-1) TaxID=378806 RepID=E3FZC3_STIAD|nr:sterol desaturase family protein [Stigmatella aurantiaca]ADO74940.1 Sterol desaturase family protein [Stigmatella aurantiaca DW4/3-1]